MKDSCGAGLVVPAAPYICNILKGQSGAHNAPEEILPLSTSTQVIFGVLIAAGYFVSPIVLIWGWARWINLAKLRTALSILSLAGFVLATASALLAVSSIAYAQVIHGFRFYDPSLMRLFRCGVLLSLGAIVFGLGGVWRPSSLRWHAPVAAIGTLAFWIMAAEAE
jgi:hypothetical protein